MKVMLKQSFKNMGYCWLMSDIVKNSFFLLEGKGLHQMRLDGRWLIKDSFRLTKEKINFNAMHILYSFRVRSLFSNFLYTMKELTKATSKW